MNKKIAKLFSNIDEFRTLLYFISGINLKRGECPIVFKRQPFLMQISLLQVNLSAFNVDESLAKKPFFHLAAHLCGISKHTVEVRRVKEHPLWLGTFPNKDAIRQK